MPPITFAHRGGRAHEAENTLPAFSRALSTGAAGLESDVWRAADGVPVLAHDGAIRRGLRRTRVATTPSDRLAELGVPTLAELYETCGTDFELSLDLKHPEAAEPTLETSRRFGAEQRLWLCSPDDAHLVALRGRNPDVHLVHSQRSSRIGAPMERHAADLAAAGVEAMNMHHTEWTGGLVALFHRFGVLAFAWDAQEIRQIRAVVRMGVDGVFSDHVDRMLEVVTRPA
ncbi:MAG: glycerophosphodiester phosphodiesterase [Acidimicrobiia bacterium]